MLYKECQKPRTARPFRDNATESSLRLEMARDQCQNPEDPLTPSYLITALHLCRPAAEYRVGSTCWNARSLLVEGWPLRPNDSVLVKFSEKSECTVALGPTARHRFSGLGSIRSCVFCQIDRDRHHRHVLHMSCHPLAEQSVSRDHLGRESTDTDRLWGT